MTALLKADTARPKDVFQDFFRSYESDPLGSKYRVRLAQLAVTNERSLVIDFPDLIAFDPSLARCVLERLDDYVIYASSAATTQMRVEDPEFADRVGRILARFRYLLETIALDKIRAEHIGKLVSVGGEIAKVSQVKLLLVTAVFRCRMCLELVVQDQEGMLIRRPSSSCPFCRQRTSFEFLEAQSKFNDYQQVRIREDKPRKHLRRSSFQWLAAELREDLVDTVQQGDRVEVTAIVRIGKLGQFPLHGKSLGLYLDANHIGKVNEDTEKHPKA